MEIGKVSKMQQPNLRTENKTRGIVVAATNKENIEIWVLHYKVSDTCLKVVRRLGNNSISVCRGHFCFDPTPT